jgi:5'/3'-nucleotidase
MFRHTLSRHRPRTSPYWPGSVPSGRRRNWCCRGSTGAANAGHAVLHSGTVGAALTAANNGVPALAVSLDVLSPAAASAESGGAAITAIDSVDDETRNWATAAAFARRLFPGLSDLPAGTVLNLNVPDLPEDQGRGMSRARLAPFGQVLIALAETGAEYMRTAIEENGARQIPGTDLALLATGTPPSHRSGRSAWRRTSR